MTGFNPSDVVFESHAEMGWDDFRGAGIVWDVVGTDNPKRWVAFAEEVRALYWTTDIPATEIRDAYLPGRPISAICVVAGAVKINRGCAGLLTESDDEVCGQQLYVATRSALAHERGSWTPMRCPDCIRSRRYSLEQRREYAKTKAEYARLDALAADPVSYTPPPDPGLSYQEYLQTDHWKACRYGALKRSGFACQVCSSEGELHVHHRTYVRRGHELDTDLIVLCAGCHELFHTNGKLADGGRAACTPDIAEAKTLRNLALLVDALIRDIATLAAAQGAISSVEAGVEQGWALVEQGRARVVQDEDKGMPALKPFAGTGTELKIVADLNKRWLRYRPRPAG